MISLPTPSPRAQWQKIRQVLYNLKNGRKRKFYLRLMFPRDDYHLRYFGHQWGKCPPQNITDVFPGIQTVGKITLLETFALVPGTSLEIGELSDLIAIALHTRAKNIIEIGTFNGQTALNLAANVPESTIITVDLPIAEQVALDDIPKRDANITDRSVVGKCFRGTPYARQIEQVYANSAELDWGAFRRRFDLVFIDGCHHEKYVRKDTENAIAHLQEKGVIVWHDYGQSEGVSAVVDMVADSLEIHAIRGTRFAVGFRNSAYG